MDIQTHNTGTPTVRQDGRAKVLGQARYAAEFSAPGMVHAVIVQSTVAAGEIEAIDTAFAMTMPGVLEIITPSNAETLHKPPKVQQAIGAPLLQDKSVLFNGQHIALVIAETLQQAQAAAAMVKTTYKQGEAVTLMDSRLEGAYTPKQKINGKYPQDTTSGDPQAAFDAASAKVEATYTTPIEHHNPMEPHATIASWDGKHLTVRTTTQGITGARQTLAGMFGLSVEDVTVICPFVGGGFGSKGNCWPPATLAAMASWQVKRPVKLEITREQMFTSNGYRPRTVQKLKLGADATGKLVSMSHDGYSQMSMPALGEFTEPVAMATRMLYASPAIATTHRVVPVNQALPTYMRAPGEASGMFALETAMDELAVALKIDPLELRLRNYAEEDPTEHRPFASKALRECYRQGAEAFGWSRRRAAPRAMRDGRVLIGLGMATSTYPTNRMPASAQVEMRADGTAWVRAGTQDLGTGTYTTMAQVAGDVLGLATDQVHVELGDSRFPPAPVSGGSMTTASVLPAVQSAAEALRDKIFALALNGWHNLKPSDLAMVDGKVQGPNGAVPVKTLLAIANMESIEATEQVKPSDESKKVSPHAFGAQFAEVRVDQDLGTIKVSRWVGAYDCGRIINPTTARSQLIGGITFGIGMALLEETRVDESTGRIVNANIAEYLMPVNADIPELQTIIVNGSDDVTTSMGVKGIGELPMVGVAAAIGNAVYNATGIRVRDLPIRLDKMLA